MRVTHAAASFRLDLAYAVRALARSPGLSAAIIVTFALGVGANAAVFTALDRVFFQAPAGVSDPGSLRRLYARQVAKSATEYGPSGRVTPFLSTRDMLDLARAMKGVARIEGDYLDRGVQTLPDKRPVRLTFVSPGYLDMLGVRIQRGRSFAPNESRLPGPAVPVAVISDAFWRTRFESDPDVVGKTVRIGETLEIRETVYTIIGVASREFAGLELESSDLWAPLTNVASGNITWLRVVMRVTSDIDDIVLAQRLSVQYRQTHFGERQIEEGSEIISAPLLAAHGPALSGNVLRIPGMSERTISVLARLGIIGAVVLVIAIANVASLLLMRAMRRRHEIAVRRALGVSNARLVGQLVIESVMLSLVAGAAAVGAAALTGGLLRMQLSPGIRWTSHVVDDRVVVLAMGAAVLGGCLAGVAPSLFALRMDVAGSLKTSAWGAGRTGTTLRSGLLITQAALCMALLASAGVVLQSLRRAQTADRGFDSDRTLLMTVPANYAGAETDLARISSVLLTVSGVETVGRSLTGIASLSYRSKVGLSASDTIGAVPEGPWVDFVDAEWGRAVGVRLIGGRMLDSSSSIAQVAVVNEALARALYRGRNVAGTCIRVREPDAPCRQVVGVVRDLRWDPSTPATYRVYIPIVQAWTRPPAALIPNYLVIRTHDITSPADVVRIRAAAAPLTSRADEMTLRRVTDMLEPQLRPWRLAATLFLVLGALGLLAAGTGIYGLVAYDVAQRTREIGLRIALGAPRKGVLRLVVESSLRVMAIGAGVGTLAALMVGKAMSSVLYATSPYDPAVLGGTAAALGVVTLAASLLPAWRATRVSPMVALSAD